MAKIKLSTIKPNPDNPRTIRAKNLNKLMDSISEFSAMMYLRPIVVDERNVILGGNQRYLALKALKYKEIPEDWIKKADGLTEEEKKRFIIADNIAFGEWDIEELKENWNVENLEKWGIDVSEWKNEEEEEENKIFEEDQEPETTEKLTTDIKRGDIFKIGENFLMCGNSAIKEDVICLIGNNEITTILTDPPYSSGGFQEAGKSSGSIGKRAEVKKKEQFGEILNDTKSTDGYINLMHYMFDNVKAKNCFIFTDWRMWCHTSKAVEFGGFSIRNMLVWDKGSMGLGGPFRNRHELICFGSNINQKGSGKTSNVLQHSRDLKNDHPTPKPVNLLIETLKCLNHKSVYDPFSGSGSTLIACIELKIPCYAMELEPLFCKLTIDRITKLYPDIQIDKIN